MFDTHDLRREAHGSPGFSSNPTYETADKPRRIFPSIYPGFPEPDGATQRELDRLNGIIKRGPPADYKYKARRKKSKSSFLKKAVYALIGFGLIALCANDCPGQERSRPDPQRLEQISYINY